MSIDLTDDLAKTIAVTLEQYLGNEPLVGLDRYLVKDIIDQLNAAISVETHKRWEDGESNKPSDGKSA